MTDRADARHVTIIGSGPAGYTAAVYAARANLAPLVFEGAVTAGGALTNTTEVKTVTDGGGTVHGARSVILSMGSAYRELGLPREKELSGHGVSWCATCDGFFFRDQVIAVVGGGDSTIEEATFLTRFARTVTNVVTP
ncbi:hypothetical protein GCM10023258_24230 [Terrabacter aeriphilus]|uniref:FAD/NAD(P)-binding domain-containing protein n=1 Tax=Terrabacter aeriphilus TaxID=515662 RepID=A0ABP9JFS5_9MICO